MERRYELQYPHIEEIQEAPITNASNINDGSTSTYGVVPVTDFTSSVDAYVNVFTLYGDFSSMEFPTFNRMQFELLLSTSDYTLVMAAIIDRTQPITSLQAALQVAIGNHIAFVDAEVSSSGSTQTVVLDFSEYINDLMAYIENDPTFLERVGIAVFFVGASEFNVNCYDAKSVYIDEYPINKVVFGSDTLIDLSQDTITDSDLAYGVTAHDADGNAITGNNTNNCDTSNDTVDSSVLVSGYTAHNSSGNSISGSMTNNGAYNISIANKDGMVYIPEGYHNGSGIVKILPASVNNLIAENIKDGVYILGVTGTYTGGSISNGIVYNSVDSDGNPTEITFYGSKLPPVAFSGYDNANNAYHYLTTAHLPNDLTAISYRAFGQDTSLVSVNLPDTITLIDTSAFYGDYNLPLSQLPSDLATINAYAFYACNSLNIYYINVATRIRDNAFGSCVGLGPKLKISAKYIGTSASSNNAFKNCTGLKAVWISSTADYIYAGSSSAAPFYGCTNLTNIYTDASAKKTNWGTYWNYTGTNTQATIHYSTSEADFDALVVS